MRLIDANAAYDILTAYYHQRTEIQRKALREALDRVPTAEPCEDVEFWRKRAEYYSKMCFDLIADINNGVKIDSIEINKDGIKFTKKQTESCDDTVGRQAAIDVNGLDEEIRCEMCKNPMHTDRGCDGNCRYDEKLYKKIIQLLNKRITPLPSAQPEIIRCKDCKHHSHDAGYGYDWCNRTSGVFRVKPEDFCSYAERREE